MGEVNITALIIVTLYLIFVSGMIIWSGRKIKTFHDYALAGNRLPWYVISLTMLVTFIGGGTMLGFVGSYYTHGLQWFWMCLSTSVAFLFLGYFIAERIRRFKLYTLADIFQIRYGENAKRISGVITCIVGVAVGFAMLSGFAAMVNGYLGINMDIAMLLGVFLFAFTATMGGLIGNALVDAWSSIIIFGGAIIVSIFAFTQAGGVAGISTLPHNLLDLSAGNIPWVFYIGTIISSAGVALADQATIFQRVNAADSPRSARRAAIWFAWSCLGVFMLMGVIGLSARVILGPGIASRNVVAELLRTMNPVIAAIYVAAVISAVLTTANSLYLSASMTFARDIVQAVKPSISDRQMVIIARLFVWVMAGISFFVIRFNPGIMRWIMLGYTAVSCLIIPLYGGLLFKRATPASGFYSLTLSIVGVLAWELAGNPGGYPSIYVAMILGTIGFVAGFSSKTKSSPEQEAMVDTFKLPLER
jgi:SSS family solute:Na+ symporter